MSKVTPVTGDVTFPGYGLSQSDLRLLTENVSVVFNSAATIKFDEELKDALEMNVKGPMQLLEICRQMKQLEVLIQLSNFSSPVLNKSSLYSQAFVHVSTAFNNLDREEMREEVYHSKVDPVKLIELLDCLEDSVVKNIATE